MWYVIGHKTHLTWNPNGAQVQRRCPACGLDTTFYEKQVTRTFCVNFVDVLDYERQRVMACGRCDAYYATDELGPPTSPIVEGLTEAATEVKGYGRRAAPYLERANNAVLDGISSLVGRPPPRRSSSSSWQAPTASQDDHDGEIDIGPDYQPPARLGRAQVERRVAGQIDDDMEARFRELEEKAAKGE